MGGDQAVPGDLPEPGVERQRPLAEVVGEPRGGLGQGLLHQVGGVDAGGQAAVEADGDHPPQAVAVAFEQELARLGLAAAGAVEQFLGIGLSGGGHRLTS